MSRHQLYFDKEVPDFRLVGISCHQRDYKAAWAVSEGMGIELERMDDWTLLIHYKPQSIMAAFPYFTATVEDDNYALVGNIFEQGFLIPELSQFDYLLLIWANHTPEMEEDMLTQLRSNRLIQFCDFLDSESLKNWHRLPGCLENGNVE